MSICLFCSLFNLCSSYILQVIGWYTYSLHSTYLFLGSSVFAIGDIVSNRGGKEDGLLTNEADMSPEPGGVQSLHVPLPEENGPVRDLVEVFDESDTCRLPAAARTHQSYHLARLHLETDALL